MTTYKYTNMFVYIDICERLIYNSKIYKRCLQKKHDAIMEGQRLFQPNVMESV